MEKQLTKKQEREQLIKDLKEANTRIKKIKEQYKTLYSSYRDGQPMGKIWEFRYKLKEARNYRNFILKEIETFNKNLKINN